MEESPPFSELAFLNFPHVALRQDEPSPSRNRSESFFLQPGFRPPPSSVRALLCRLSIGLDTDTIFCFFFFFFFFFFCPTYLFFWRSFFAGPDALSASASLLRSAFSFRIFLREPFETGLRLTTGLWPFLALPFGKKLPFCGRRILFYATKLFQMMRVGFAPCYTESSEILDPMPPYKKSFRGGVHLSGTDLPARGTSFRDGRLAEEGCPSCWLPPIAGCSFFDPGN